MMREVIHFERTFGTLFDYDVFDDAWSDMLYSNGYRYVEHVIEKARAFLKTDTQKSVFEEFISDPSFEIEAVKHDPYWLVTLEPDQEELELETDSPYVLLFSDRYELAIELTYGGMCYFDCDQNMIECKLNFSTKFLYFRMRKEYWIDIE